MAEDQVSTVFTALCSEMNRVDSEDDRKTILELLVSRYQTPRQRGQGSQQEEGRGGRGRGSRNSSRGRGQTGRGRGSSGSSVPDAGSGTANGGGDDLVDDDKGVLPDVLLRLAPLIGALPEAKRDPSADKPSMTRLAVQKRINQRRRELGIALDLADGHDCPRNSYELCNKVQSFRLAAADAMTTDGVRLRTSPIKDELRLHRVLRHCIAVAHERERSEEVSPFGFLTDSDEKYESSESDQAFSEIAEQYFQATDFPPEEEQTDGHLGGG